MQFRASGENIYVLGGGSITADLGFTKYRHVYELAGVVKQYDIDASVVDATIEVGRFNAFQGVTFSCGVGLDAGLGAFSSSTILWAYTKQDLTNAFNAYMKVKYINNEHASLGRKTNIVSNIYVDGKKISSLIELLNPNINEIYYSFDIFDPDENDISNATPLQSIVLVKFSKPYNDLPYYRTINVSNEKRN